MGSASLKRGDSLLRAPTYRSERMTQALAVFVANLAACGARADLDTTADGAGSGVPSPTVVAISAGTNHTCALTSDGTVACWGDDYNGQLGNGTRNNSPTPVTVSGLRDITAISADGDHTCALRSDHTVACWGDNTYDEPSDGAVLSGAFGSPTPRAVSSLHDVAGISCGGGHTCTVLLDRTVKCWGGNLYGQLGDGTANASQSPVLVVNLPGAMDVSAGGTHTCALLSDATVACWGDNAYGQLGNGTATASMTPVAIPNLRGVVAVSAHGAHTCALLSDATVACWGDNDYGQLVTAPRAGRSLARAIRT
jgi:alpha-tubulin suppressor-like RCC1 family protein